MGLSLRLGCLDDHWLADLDRANAALEAAGLAPHSEPKEIDKGAVQRECRFAEFQDYPSLAFPYSFVHLLRRIHTRAKLGIDPLGEPVQDASDDDEYRLSLADSYPEIAVASHLCWHSDTDGYYLPVDFPRPLTMDGEAVGSSVGLAAELAVVGEALGYTDLDQWLAQEDDESDPWEREKHCWAAMTEMTRLSLKFRTALVFS